MSESSQKLTPEMRARVDAFLSGPGIIRNGRWWDAIDWIAVLHDAAKASGAASRLSCHDLKTMADAVCSAIEADPARRAGVQP